MYTAKTFVVIMAGGTGTRLWPIFSPSHPKQTQPLFRGESLLQQCVDRASMLVPIEQILIITGKSMVEQVYQQIPKIPHDNIIVEPSPKNTAPCIALALYHIKKRS